MLRDEERATTASYGFWASSMLLLEQVGLENAWERLQALQLLTHYAFLNPKDVDCSKCAAATTSLCTQLGLQKNWPDAVRLNTRVVDTRRRLLWNSYSIDS